MRTSSPKERAYLSSEDWTPYGLEHIRVQYLRRRQMILWLLLLLLLLAIVALIGTSSERTESISINGRDGNTIQIDKGEEGGKKGGNDHVSVSLEPGRVTRAESGSTSSGPTVTSVATPQFTRAAPYNWNAFLILYGPYVLLGLLAWFLAKRRSRHHEVNFGVYKGSMPFEMITATHSGSVFTRKMAESSLFGKGRPDHLPREIADVEPATMETEEADAA